MAGSDVAPQRRAKALDGAKGENGDQDAGIAIVRRALEAPLRQIEKNVGVDGSIVAAKMGAGALPMPDMGGLM